MQKKLISILFISVLLTSCTQKTDNIEVVIKEKEQLESNLELANKHIELLEKKLDGVSTDAKENEKSEEKEKIVEENNTSDKYSLEDFKGVWIADDPNIHGVYIDEHVVMNIMDGEINTWGFIEDYKIYEDQLIFEKYMAKIEDSFELDEIYLYDTYVIGDRNGRAFISNSLDSQRGMSYYKRDQDMGEDIAREIQQFDPVWYREFYGTEYDYLFY